MNCHDMRRLWVEKIGVKNQELSFEHVKVKKSIRYPREVWGFFFPKILFKF